MSKKISGRAAATTKDQGKRADRQFYKLLTYDFRSPIQGGEPIFDGKTFPFKLNGATLDKSDSECAPGWNFVDSIETGFRIVGMWPTGRPSQVLIVTPSDDKIQRGNKWRASCLTLERLATVVEIEAAIERFSDCFVAYSKEMAREQILWREALSRPLRDINKVTQSLEMALKTRGLAWKLEQFDYARAARAARDAWAAWAAWDARDAWDAWDEWDAWGARDARAARDAWAAWDAWDARDAWDAWDARDAWDAWGARDAWAAWAAWAALTVNFASLNQWIKYPSNLLTTGIRDAYQHGLEIALPIGKDTLGFSVNP